MNTVRLCGIAIALPDAATLRTFPLALGLIAAIIAIHFLSAGHDAQRLLQVAFIIVAACLLSFQAIRNTPQPGLSVRVAAPLSLLFLIGIASSWAARFPRHALSEVFLLSSLVIIAIAVAAEMRTAFICKLRILLTCLALAWVVYLISIAAVILGASWTGTRVDMEALAPGFSNYRFLNHAQTVSIPLLVLLSCVAGPAYRRGWMVIASLWFIPLYALGGRGTALGLAAGGVVAILLQRRNAALFMRNMIVAGIGGLVLYWTLFIVIPQALGYSPLGLLGSVIERTVADPTSMRTPLWERCVVLISAHPLLGAGPMHFAHYSSDIYIGAHPHNWVLQIAAEWGLPAFGVVFGLLAAAASTLLRAGKRLSPVDKEGQTLLTAWLLIGTAVMVDGLVSGLIVMPVSQLLIVLYGGCVGGWILSMAPAREPARPRAPWWVATVLLMVVALGLCLCIAPEVSDYFAGTLHVDKPPELRGMRPRFWAEGYF